MLPTSLEIGFSAARFVTDTVADTVVVVFRTAESQTIIARPDMILIAGGTAATLLGDEL